MAGIHDRCENNDRPNRKPNCLLLPPITFPDGLHDMPKARKKKAPITGPGTSEVASGKPETTRMVIRRFHGLLKRQTQLEQASTKDAATAQELAKIAAEIEALGGLEKYQEMSAIGQSSDRGGGSEKVLIGWLKELQVKPAEGSAKLRYVFHTRGIVTCLTKRMHVDCWKLVL